MKNIKVLFVLFLLVIICDLKFAFSQDLICTNISHKKAFFGLQKGDFVMIYDSLNFSFSHPEIADKYIEKNLISFVIYDSLSSFQKNYYLYFGSFDFDTKKIDFELNTILLNKERRIESIEFLNLNTLIIKFDTISINPIEKVLQMTNTKNDISILRINKSGIDEYKFSNKLLYILKSDKDYLKNEF